MSWRRFSRMARKKKKHKKEADRIAKRITRFSNYIAERMDSVTDEVEKRALEEKLEAFKNEQERNFIHPSNAKKPKAKIYPPIRKQSGKKSGWIRFVQGGATGLKK